MKKLIAIICAVLSAILLASCTTTAELKIREDNSVIISQRIELSEEEFTTYKEMIAEEKEINGNYGNIESINFKQDTKDGKKIYVFEQSVVGTLAQANSLFSESSYYDATQPTCVYGKLTKTDVWGRPSKAIKAAALANANIDFRLIFPYKIVATNGIKEDDNTVLFNVDVLKGNYFYATTEKSTAGWAKSSNVDTAVKNIVNNYIFVVGVGSNLTSKNTATIRWSKDKKATYYEVYKRETSKGKWNLLTTSKGNECTDKGFKPGLRYYYRVRGVNQYYKSIFDSEYYDYVQPINGKPKITDVYVESKTVSFSVNYSTYISGTKIYMSTKKNGTYKAVKARYMDSYYDCTDFYSKKLKKGTYYFKAMGYQKSGGNKWFGDMSNAKKVVVK